MHNFFHSKSFFQTHERIEPEVIQATHGESKLIEKGNALLMIAKGLIQKAVPARSFSWDVVAAHIISDKFEVIIYSSFTGHKRYLFFKNKIIDRKNIVSKTNWEYSLYMLNRVPEIYSFQTVSHVSKPKYSCKEWHQLLANIFLLRY